jgi:hypothetical protein
MSCQWFAAGLFLFVTPVFGDESDELLPPVQIHAGSRAMDVEHVGHAAPFIGDFYEDGGLALLVGQFYEGRLRIYRNIGTRAKPRFDSYTWFEAGGKIARVPVG